MLLFVKDVKKKRLTIGALLVKLMKRCYGLSHTESNRHIDKRDNTSNE